MIQYNREIIGKCIAEFSNATNLEIFGVIRENTSCEIRLGEYKQDWIKLGEDYTLQNLEEAINTLLRYIRYYDKIP